MAISNAHILTSAHCFDNRNHENIIILAYLHEVKDSGKPQDWGNPWYTMKSYKNHEKYDPQRQIYDISIVTINEDKGDILRTKPVILEEENYHPSSILQRFY